MWGNNEIMDLRLYFLRTVSWPVALSLLISSAVVASGAVIVVSWAMPEILLLDLAQSSPVPQPSLTQLPSSPVAVENEEIESETELSLPSAASLPPSEVAGARTTTPSPQQKPVRTVYVGVGGIDATGRGAATTPWKTIHYALTQAAPGTVIIVKPGTYAERITTVRNGTAAQPITLQAEGKVILTGNQGRIMEVTHDYHVIKGFEFKGGDIQLWLQEADNTVISSNYFHHAQGECVRLKYHSSHTLFENNRVEFCGQEDFGGGGDGKNGEGVYIGTAPEQLDKNPTPESDYSNANLVRYNTFNTRGNECVDIKEGSEKNIIEFNNCTGQRDPESGGMDSRGNRNVFRYNRIYNNKGAGIRFGGDTEQDGLHNEAYGNVITSNAREALKITRTTQGKICGNTATGNMRGLSNKKEVQNPACAFPLLPPGVK